MSELVSEDFGFSEIGGQSLFDGTFDFDDSPQSVSLFAIGNVLGSYVCSNGAAIKIGKLKDINAGDFSAIEVPGQWGNIFHVSYNYNESQLIVASNEGVFSVGVEDHKSTSIRSSSSIKAVSASPTKDKILILDRSTLYVNDEQVLEGVVLSSWASSGIYAANSESVLLVKDKQIQKSIAFPEIEDASEIAVVSINEIGDSEVFVSFSFEEDGDINCKSFLLNTSLEQFSEVDVAVPFGSVERQNYYYFASLANWIKGNKYTFVTSGTATDINVLLQNDQVHVLIPADDQLAVSFPMDDEGDDMSPVGMAIDLTNIDVKAENLSNTLDEATGLPKIWVYTHNFLLLSWWVFDVSACKNGSASLANALDLLKIANSETEEKEKKPEAPQVSSESKPTFGSLGSADAKPTFGSSGFGSSESKPAFGSSGFGSSGSKPSFGSSGFGSSESKPAFGSSGFGSSDAKPAFGSSGFGSIESKPSFGSSGFGSTESKPSFGSSGFGSTESKPSFGSSGFGSTESKPSFGSSGFGSTESKPSFGSSSFGSSGGSSHTFGSTSFGQSKTSAFGAPSQGTGGGSGFASFASGSTGFAAAKNDNVFGNSNKNENVFGNSSKKDDVFGSSLSSTKKDDVFGKKSEPEGSLSPFAGFASKSSLSFDSVGQNKKSESSPFAAFGNNTKKDDTKPESLFGGLSLGSTKQLTSFESKLEEKGQSLFGESKPAFGSNESKPLFGSEQKEQKLLFGSKPEDSKPLFGSKPQQPAPSFSFKPEEKETKSLFGSNQEKESKPSFESKPFGLKTEEQTKPLFGGDSKESKPSFSFKPEEKEPKPSFSFKPEEKETKSLFCSKPQESKPLFGSKTEEHKPLFGSKPEEKESKPLFGSKTEESKPLFGLKTEEPKPLFGSKPEESKSLFGSKPEVKESKPLFGSKQEESKPLFGLKTEESKPLFGSKPEVSKSLFGSKPEVKESKPLFGSKQEESKPLFGSKTEEKETKSLFGSKPEESKPLFGSKPEESKPLFSSKPEGKETKSLFGSETKESKPLFVSKPEEKESKPLFGSKPEKSTTEATSSNTQPKALFNSGEKNGISSTKSVSDQKPPKSEPPAVLEPVPEPTFQYYDGLSRPIASSKDPIEAKIQDLINNLNGQLEVLNRNHEAFDTFYQAHHHPVDIETLAGKPELTRLELTTGLVELFNKEGQDSHDFVETLRTQTKTINGLTEAIDKSLVTKSQLDKALTQLRLHVEYTKESHYEMYPLDHRNAVLQASIRKKLGHVMSLKDKLIGQLMVMKAQNSKGVSGDNLRALLYQINDFIVQKRKSIDHLATQIIEAQRLVTNSSNTIDGSVHERMMIAQKIGKAKPRFVSTRKLKTV